MNKPITSGPWVSNIQFETILYYPSKLELNLTVRVIQFGVFLVDISHRTVIGPV